MRSGWRYERVGESAAALLDLPERGALGGWRRGCEWSEELRPVPGWDAELITKPGLGLLWAVKTAPSIAGAAPEELWILTGGAMLDKYIDWDRAAMELLRRHGENAVALANLREEYASLTDGPGAVDYTKDRVAASGEGNDAMVNRYIRKSTLEKRIGELDREERQYRRAWAALTEEERRILEEFFQRGRRQTEEAVEVLCGALRCERRTVFYKRKAALQKFKRMLYG